jgi:hypothetical protein
MAKFTMSSVKSFVRKNKGNLKIKTKYVYDASVDGCVYVNRTSFVPVVKTSLHEQHTLGMAGAWFVGGGRDMVSPILSGDKVVGFKCFNGCASFEVMV